MVKNLPAMGRPGFDPWVGKIPWRREWLPTPVFLPREFHGQRSLTSKEMGTAVRLTNTHIHKILRENLTLKSYKLRNFRKV